MKTCKKRQLDVKLDKNKIGKAFTTSTILQQTHVELKKKFNEKN